LKMKGTKKIVFLAGKRSHGHGEHEHRAGCMLLAKLMNEGVPGTYSVVYTNGWPHDVTALDNADAVVIYCDGGGGHGAGAGDESHRRRSGWS